MISKRHKTMKKGRWMHSEREVKRRVARWVLESYDLCTLVDVKDGMEIDGYYLPDEDKIILNSELDGAEFIKSTIHEAKHAMDAMRYGRDKFRKKYEQASVVAVNCGNDPYIDNKWEVRAEKFAEREMSIKWKDLTR